MGQSTDVRVFTPDGHILMFGTEIIKGWADGEYGRWAPDDDLTEESSGTDGEITITRKNNNLSIFTVILNRTSMSNDALSAYAHLTATAARMAGAIQPFLFKDKFGATLISADNAWIKRQPDRSFDKVPKMIEWQIRLAHAKKFDGGNP